ncbi:MAG: class I SAM-dependent methyltransferase [Candidatus Omnitrophica bacterium]|nr:class I SAM-dependent methyltransferase [Candidatus Omnitrophota bacterium]
MHCINNVFKRYIPFLYKLRKKMRLLYKPDSYLVMTGFMKSLLVGYPCTLEGEPIPWMNYNAVSFLKERLRKDMKLFEYGSGYSTVFFSRLVATVTSVEHNKDWYEKVKKKVGNNVTLIYQACEPLGDYCKVISTLNDTFDVVVIDGKERVQCVPYAMKALSDRGVIIFDDIVSDERRKGVEILLNNKFRKIDFEGLAANRINLTRTSIFYRDKNCFGL